MSDTKHPLALLAEQRAEDRNKRRKAAKAVITAATSQGVHFVEIHPEDFSTPFPYKPAKVGHMTIAYVVDRRNVIAVSTALCHSGDDFDKNEGRARAAIALAEGRYIHMRVPNPSIKATKAFLKDAFTVNTYRSLK